MQLLLQEHPDIDAKTDRQVRTALHIAYETNNAMVIKLLLKAGADPGIEDVDGKRPSDLAPVADG